MSCAGSERAESNKGFDCRNMGEVLGKECVKEEPSFTRSSQDLLREVGKGGISSDDDSDIDSNKEILGDSDDDFSWLLSFNKDELITEKCKCEGCLRRSETYDNGKKDAKLMLSSWKELQSYIRNVYINSPLESAHRAEVVPIEENGRLYEMIQIMRLCDPYQLFQKIEEEVRAMVLESRERQLTLLKREFNPVLAGEFIAGLIEEYVKLLSSALQLGPAIDILLMSQFQRFRLTWDMLNKHLYQSLVYSHDDIQKNLPRFISHLTVVPFKNDLYHELVHQYLAFDDEMSAIAEDWEKIEPVIEEYKKSKMREIETLNSLQDALKSFFAGRSNSDEVSNSEGNENSQYCPNCLTMRGCPCGECTITHVLSCEGMESSPIPDSPIPRSRTPNKEKEGENKDEINGEQQQSCECHACTVPPPELMDCSAAFNQLATKNSHGEGFQLYPHIHGTVAENLYEADNVPNIYNKLPAAPDSVYPHLYNLHNQPNSIVNIPQMNLSGANPNRPLFIQTVAVKDIQSITRINAKQEKLLKPMPANIQAQLPNCPYPLPPPPPQENSTSAKVAPPKNSTRDKTAPNAAVKAVQPKQMPNTTASNGDISKSTNVKIDEKKNQPAIKNVPPTESDQTEKAAKLAANNKVAACVKSSLCGKCCLRHGPNCLKTPRCGKDTDKHLAAIARLGLTPNTNSRGTLRCAPGKENEHTHKPGKGHSCGKLKTHDVNKRVINGKLRGQEPDDSSSQDDTCSERSNSTSASAQKESRHCDCCYCEVFGHGVPSVAPVSRNYQEMRERLRIKLNMKKSAKCKAGEQAPQPGTAAGSASGTGNPKYDGKKLAPGEQDLESVLKFIEGKTREPCKDPKRIAKRARQKQKKLEEKERLEEEEAERRRLEAMKRAQAAKQNQSQNQNQQHGKRQQQQHQQQQQQQQANTKSTHNNNNNNSNKNNNSNRNSAGNNNNNSNNNNNNNQARNSQTLNLSGLKSLVEKSDPNSGPKMVTIRRVMAPFSAEPTVTITLKGSTPDKDKVLFMLKNGSETYQPEEKESSKKSKKKKKKAKKEEEYYEEDEEQESYREEEQEPVVEKTGGRKRRRNKNKTMEVVDNKVKSPRSTNKQDSSKLTATDANKNSKTKISKSGSNNSKSNVGKTQVQSVNKTKTSNASVSAKSSQNSSSTQVSNSRGKSQKNVPVLKAQNQNVKNRENSNNKNVSKNASNVKNSSSSNNKSVNNKNSNSVKSTLRNSNNVNNVSNVSNVVTKNSKKQKQSGAVSGVNGKSVANQSAKTQPVNSKQSKKKSEEITQRQVQTVQTKGKLNDPKVKTMQKVGKNASENVHKVQQRQEVKQSVQGKERQQENIKKMRNSQKTVLENRDLSTRFSMGGGYDRGKVVINTPSYRLSEVLSSIAPSPPPKEEINLENLRLPPGITITKIEGPITKSIRANDQPLHVSKPVPSTPPIVVSTPTLKQSHPAPPGNVIVVDTGRLKEVIKENSPNPTPAQSTTTSKRKKKKAKQNAESALPTMEVPMSQSSKYPMKLTKGSPLVGKSGVTVISADEARKMVPNLENQQATIIKTSDNMVTIRSPAFQQAMNMHAYQNSQSFRPGINGYNNVTLFQNDVNRITDNIGKLKIGSDDKLANQMRNLNIKEGSRASQIFAQAMAVAGQNGQDATKKKKKKRKSGSNRSDDKEVEPVESVFQPKDIDLENGDIDDDERELEAFKRFCLQSVPSERKNKVKVNLNIKDIVLKKKSAIGCS